MKRRWIKKSGYGHPNPQRCQLTEKYFHKLCRRRFRRRFNNIPIHQLDFEDFENEIQGGINDPYY